MPRKYRIQDIDIDPRQVDRRRVRALALVLLGWGLAGGIIIYWFNWWRCLLSARALPPPVEPATDHHANVCEQVGGLSPGGESLQDCGESADVRSSHATGKSEERSKAPSRICLGAPGETSSVPSINDALIQAIVEGAGTTEEATRGERVSWDQWRSFCGRVLLKQVAATAVIDFPFADMDGLKLVGDARLVERAYVFDDPSFNAGAAGQEETRVVLHVHTLGKWGDRDKSAAEQRALRVTSVNVRFAVRAAGGAAGSFQQDKGSTYGILPKSSDLRPGLWQGLFTGGKGKMMEWSWKDVLNDVRGALPALESKDAAILYSLYKEVARVIQLGERLCAQGKWLSEAGSLAQTNEAIRGGEGGRWEVVGQAAPGPGPAVRRVCVPEHVLLEMMNLLDIVGGAPRKDATEEGEAAQGPAVRGLNKSDAEKFFEGVSKGVIVPTCIIDFPYADKTEGGLCLVGDDRLVERLYCFGDPCEEDQRVVVHAHTLLRWGDRPKDGAERARFVTSVNVRHAKGKPFKQELGKLSVVPVSKHLKKAGRWQEIFWTEVREGEEKGAGFSQEQSLLTWRWDSDVSVPGAEPGDVLSHYEGIREVLRSGERLCQGCVEIIETFNLSQTQGAIRGGDGEEFELVGFLREEASAPLSDVVLVGLRPGTHKVMPLVCAFGDSFVLPQNVVSLGILI